MFGETSKILRAENHFPPALLLRAKAEYFSGDFEKAEKSCRRLLRIRPSSNEGKYYLARIMYENGESAIAAGLTESILTDFPHDIRTLRLAAEIASETGRRDEAVILLDRAAEFSAENALVLLDRARLRWTAGKKHDALEDLSRARAMLPWDTPLSRSINNLEKTIKEAL
jgi:tetratricopeptide (TPR) repeat protein